MSGTHCAVMIFTWPNLQLGDVVFDCEWKSGKNVEAISVRDGWMDLHGRDKTHESQYYKYYP